MLNSGIKFRTLREIKKYILTLVLSEKKILNETKNKKSDSTISSLSINRSMHDFFHNRIVIIPQPILITHIHISLVSVWEVNFFLFNSMLKYVINRLMHAFFHFRTGIIPQPISTLGPPKALWSISVSRDDNSPLADIGLSG